MWWLNWRSSLLVTLIRVLSADYADFICSKLPWAENTHLLRKEKYHWTADLLFDQLGFGQTSKPVYSFNSTKQLNPNQTNRSSAVQWYFPLWSKWVFSALGQINRKPRPFWSPKIIFCLIKLGANLVDFLIWVKKNTKIIKNNKEAGPGGGAWVWVTNLRPLAWYCTGHKNFNKNFWFCAKLIQFFLKDARFLIHSDKIFLCWKICLSIINKHFFPKNVIPWIDGIGWHYLVDTLHTPLDLGSPKIALKAKVGHLDDANNKIACVEGKQVDQGDHHNGHSLSI